MMRFPVDCSKNSVLNSIAKNATQHLLACQGLFSAYFRRQGISNQIWILSLCAIMLTGCNLSNSEESEVLIGADTGIDIEFVEKYIGSTQNYNLSVGMEIDVQWRGQNNDLQQQLQHKTQTQIEMSNANDALAPGELSTPTEEFDKIGRIPTPQERDQLAKKYEPGLTSGSFSANLLYTKNDGTQLPKNSDWASKTLIAKKSVSISKNNKSTLFHFDDAGNFMEPFTGQDYKTRSAEEIKEKGEALAKATKCSLVAQTQDSGSFGIENGAKYSFVKVGVSFSNDTAYGLPLDLSKLKGFSEGQVDQFLVNKGLEVTSADLGQGKLNTHRYIHELIKHLKWDQDVGLMPETLPIYKDYLLEMKGKKQWLIMPKFLVKKSTVRGGINTSDSETVYSFHCTKRSEETYANSYSPEIESCDISENPNPTVSTSKEGDTWITNTAIKSNCETKKWKKRRPVPVTFDEAYRHLQTIFTVQ